MKLIFAMTLGLLIGSLATVTAQDWRDYNREYREQERLNQERQQTEIMRQEQFERQQERYKPC